MTAAARVGAVTLSVLATVVALPSSAYAELVVFTTDEPCPSPLTASKVRR
jgi:hypothetical protein